MGRSMKDLARKIKFTKFWFNQLYRDQYSFIHINKCGGTSVEHALGIPKIHDTVEQRIKKIGKRRWDSRFTFTLVRHPYSKVVSHYNYRTKTNQNALLESPLDINSWIKASYGERRSEFYDNPLMFSPCSEWLIYDGDIAVSLVVKLEELNMRWSDICKNLNVTTQPFVIKNSTGMFNPFDATKILSIESIEIINKRFRSDFENFNYKMLN